MTARVPFALVGVVLLVGSTALVGSLERPSVGPPAVDRAMDRLDAETQSALRDAVWRAAHNAARDPVTAPAATEYGAVVNSSQPFRDVLRVRIYLRVREALSRLAQRRHGVDVRAAVPPVEGPADLRRAKRRVELTRAGPNGTALRVSVRNVTLTAARDGRVLGSRTRSPTLTVPVPTLAVHERVERYERRLGAGPLQPGLGRRLTARLYPLVWARGYAQYGGGPIGNVLANRHVALSTNGAVLSVQRDAFGHTDPAARAVLDRAAARTALRDLLAGTEIPVGQYLRAVRGVGVDVPTLSETLDEAEAQPAVGPEETVTVGINGTADDAFLTTHGEFARILGRSYSERVWLTQRVRELGTEQVEPVESPGPEWSHDRSNTFRSVSVRDREPEPPRPAAGVGEHVLAVHGRTVVITHRTYHYWTGPERGSERTESETIERIAVRLTLHGNHTLGPAPVGPIASVHERGGPFDGPNLADVHAKSHDRLLASRGGPDELARRAAAGEDVSGSAVVAGDRPDRLASWVYADLVGLRERVADISTITTRGDLATYRTNPPAVLASKLRAHRDRLVDAPETYPHVASRARVAARSAYVETVLERLERRARTRERSLSNLEDRLAAGTNSTSPERSLRRLQAGYDRRLEWRAPESPDLSMRVDAEPSYLLRSAVGHDTVPAVDPELREHPLVAKNRNVVTLPYRDAADAIVGFILGPDRTRLRTGAQVLRAVEQGGDTVSDVDRAALESQVRRGIRAGSRAARSTLAGLELGDPATREETVTEALARWQTPGRRALAVSNGSAAAAIHGLAVDRWGGQLTERTRDLLALRLERRIELGTTAERARPAEPRIDGAIRRLRTALEAEITARVGDAAANASKAAVEKATGRSLARLPAGMPVAPAPGFWYATVNLWQVRVAGEYVRFTVRVPRGTPDTPGGQLHYVRDAGTVRLDVDGDGERELLGRSTRLSFRTGTAVAIAVPPGPQGVGDVDGEAVETSAGWPEPGPAGTK